LGEIVYKTLIRFILILLTLWFSKTLFDENIFWVVSILAIFFFVFHPAYMVYKKFVDDNKNVITNSLCSTCKHFNESAVLCTKYDKHPTDNFIPCEGTDWEPR
jgi:glucan phosphoethanolaminetransferase (alkaline phosphatase superfamily)